MALGGITKNMKLALVVRQLLLTSTKGKDLACKTFLIFAFLVEMVSPCSVGLINIYVQIFLNHT